MGWDPDRDDATEILNGGFDDASAWNITHSWLIGAGVAHATGFITGGGQLLQQCGFLEGFRYRVTFTILNYNCTDPPNDGITLTVGGVTSGLFNANGTYTFEVVPTDNLGWMHFDGFTLELADSLDLDNIILVKMENYVENVLEIDVREPKISSTFQAVATDYYSAISNRQDNSGILISFDLP